jgi:hypothetical protein
MSLVPVRRDRDRDDTQSGPPVSGGRSQFLQRNRPTVAAVPDPPAATPAPSVEPPPEAPNGQLDSGAHDPSIPVPPYAVPHMGWPKWKYRGYKLIGKPGKLVPLSNKEMLVRIEEALEMDRQIVAQRFEEYILYREAWLRYLVSQMQITICFVNVKGGASKSTIAVYIGSIISDLTRRTVFLLPATQATETSTTALYAGIDLDDTLTVGEFAAKFEELGDYRKVSGLVPRTPYGLAVISEDPDDDVDVNVEFRRAEFVNVYRTLYPSVDAMLLDTGNDTINLDSVSLEAVRVADVMVVPATVGNEATLEKSSSTINKYRSAPPTEENIPAGTGAVRSGAEIAIREKALNSVVVFSKAKPGQTADDYVKFTKRRDRKGNVLGEIGGDAEGFVGDIHLIPEDERIGKNVRADLNAIDRNTTYVALLDTAIAIYEKAAELKGVKLPDPDDVLAQT